MNSQPFRNDLVQRMRERLPLLERDDARLALAFAPMHCVATREEMREHVATKRIPPKESTRAETPALTEGGQGRTAKSIEDSGWGAIIATIITAGTLAAVEFCRVWQVEIVAWFERVVG